MFCKLPKAAPTSIDQAREFLLAHQSSSPNNLVILPESLTFHETRKVVGTAFGGKTAARGEPILAEIMEPLGVMSDERTKDRQELAAFTMGFFAYELLQEGGIAFGVKDDEDEESRSSSLKAVIVFREYDVVKEDKQPKFIKKIVEYITYMRAYLTMKRDPDGSPSILSEKGMFKEYQESSKKATPMATQMHDLHREHGPPEPHWYIGLVASDAETQGKGYCKEAMNILTRAADECGMKCYLECGDRNIKYYEKFGFEVTELVTIRLGDGGGAFPGALMTRQPQSV